MVWVRSHANKWPKELESLSLFSYNNDLFEMLLTINFDNSGGHILHLSLLQPGTLQARKRMQSHVSIYLFIYLASHIYSQWKICFPWFWTHLFLWISYLTPKRMTMYFVIWTKPKIWCCTINYRCQLLFTATWCIFNYPWILIITIARIYCSQIHQCKWCFSTGENAYTLNERLFPVPIHGPEASCSVCHTKRESEYETEGSYVRWGLLQS